MKLKIVCTGFTKLECSRLFSFLTQNSVQHETDSRKISCETLSHFTNSSTTLWLMNFHLKLTLNYSNPRRCKHTSNMLDFLIFKNLSCIIPSTKNILSHLITTLFYTNANSFISLLSIKDSKKVFLLIRTYPFFWKIQCWQVQSSGVGRFPVNRHYVTIIISQSIPNPGERNKATKMQALKQAATDQQ